MQYNYTLYLGDKEMKVKESTIVPMKNRPEQTTPIVDGKYVVGAYYPTEGDKIGIVYKLIKPRLNIDGVEASNSGYIIPVDRGNLAAKLPQYNGSKKAYFSTVIINPYDGLLATTVIVNYLKDSDKENIKDYPIFDAIHKMNNDNNTYKSWFLPSTTDMRYIGEAFKNAEFKKRADLAKYKKEVYHTSTITNYPVNEINPNPLASIFNLESLSISQYYYFEKMPEYPVIFCHKFDKDK